MAAAETSALSLNSPVFRAFVTYAVIVVGKTMIMSLVTTLYRFRHKAFINPEDTFGLKDREGGPLKAVLHDPNVERIRRCHLNDLENVFPFVMVGLLYVGTSPPLASALLHFRLFAGARMLHTAVYLMAVRQPARALTFCVGLFTTLSMAYSAVTASGFTL